MVPINEEVVIKQEILEISLSGSSPTLNTGNPGKKGRHKGAEKRTAAARTPKKAPKILPKLGGSSSALANKLTLAQKDALRFAFTGHHSVPSLASRNAWACANNVKGETVHKYCRYLRDKSKQNLVKQEPGMEPQVEAEWHLNVNNVPTSIEERDTQTEQGEAPTPVRIDVSTSHQSDFLANLCPSMTAQPHAIGTSEPLSDPTLHAITLNIALDSPQMPDSSFLSDARFFNLLTGPEAIVYDDLHDPITFCMKFQDSLCSLDMEVVHEALRTMYFFEEVSLANCCDRRGTRYIYPRMNVE